MMEMLTFGKGGMTQVYNFSAGPAVLPVLWAQAEMLDWHGSGMSVMK